MKYLFAFLLFGIILSCGDESEKKATVSQKDGSINPKTETAVSVKKDKKKNSQPNCKEIEGLLIAHVDSIPEYYSGVVFYCREDKVQLLYNYKDGKKDGISREWNSDGQLWIEENYKDGKMDGLYRKWDGDGDLWIENNFKEGEEEGLQRAWYGPGKLMYEWNIKNGQKDGLVRKWHRNGKLSLEQTYENGLLEGFDRSWYEDGQIKWEYWRVNGNIRKTKYWNVNGERRNNNLEGIE
jgi:antitoxin component YwqK of YwqJK toxin-antitoxin module